MNTRVQILAGRDAVQRRQSVPQSTGTLQRKCACGGSGNSGGECADCKKKKLQRRAAGPELQTVPPIVHDVLRSPGQPLDAQTRAFFESRFGHDFGSVRIHSGEQAAESAASVNALAYAAGPRIVFAQGQYRPGTSAGRELLAHELTHVVQQQGASGSVNQIGAANSPLEKSADATAKAVLTGSDSSTAPGLSSTCSVQRKVGTVNCPPNVFGAPADPKAALETVDPIAVDLATQAATALAADATTAKAGIPAAPSVTFQAYEDHFGLPNAEGKGFLNRLTGAIRPSQEIATSEELSVLSRRFRMVAQLFHGTVNYRCPGAATVAIPGCGDGNCGTSFAFSCRGGGTIALCTPFWAQLPSDAAKAAALIHEATHIIFGEGSSHIQGAVVEGQQRGPGRNFNVAGCYEFIIDAIAGVDSLPVCPPVPAG